MSLNSFSKIQYFIFLYFCFISIVNLTADGSKKSNLKQIQSNLKPPNGLLQKPENTHDSTDDVVEEVKKNIFKLRNPKFSSAQKDFDTKVKTDDPTNAVKLNDTSFKAVNDDKTKNNEDNTKRDSNDKTENDVSKSVGVKVNKAKKGYSIQNSRQTNEGKKSDGKVVDGNSLKQNNGLKKKDQKKRDNNETVNDDDKIESKIDMGLTQYSSNITKLGDDVDDKNKMQNDKANGDKDVEGGGDKGAEVRGGDDNDGEVRKGDDNDGKDDDINGKLNKDVSDIVNNGEKVVNDGGSKNKNNNDNNNNNNDGPNNTAKIANSGNTFLAPKTKGLSNNNNNNNNNSMNNNNQNNNVTPNKLNSPTTSSMKTDTDPINKNNPPKTPHYPESQITPTPLRKNNPNLNPNSNPTPTINPLNPSHFLFTLSNNKDIPVSKDDSKRIVVDGDNKKDTTNDDKINGNNTGNTNNNKNDTINTINTNNKNDTPTINTNNNKNEDNTKDKGDKTSKGGDGGQKDADDGDNKNGDIDVKHVGDGDDDDGDGDGDGGEDDEDDEVGGNGGGVVKITNISPNAKDSRPNTVANGKSHLKGSKAEGGESSTRGRFMPTIVSLIVMAVCLYILYHNKKKIIAYVIEGRKAGPMKRRPQNSSPSAVQYTSLANVEEGLDHSPPIKADDAKNFIF